MSEFTYRLALRIFRGVPVKKTTLYITLVCGFLEIQLDAFLQTVTCWKNVRSGQSRLTSLSICNSTSLSLDKEWLKQSSDLSFISREKKWMLFPKNKLPSSKLCYFETTTQRLNDLLTGVKCRATSVAKNHEIIDMVILNMKMTILEEGLPITGGVWVQRVIFHNRRVGLQVSNWFNILRCAGEKANHHKIKLLFKTTPPGLQWLSPRQVGGKDFAAPPRSLATLFSCKTNG